ncbi:hypothetical protein [Prauserella shujinwangii]|uniref:hypothetical protein n=1 Tax=Prauserella shujinwangii TaxID=1453103 RepID=UPI001FE31663|nr:hypothetical protein [Prauserella shujinwangii]
MTGLRVRRGVAALALTVAGPALAGCALPGLSAHPASAPATVDVAALPELRVAPEDTGAHYDRDDWPHWTSVGDGCDVRDECSGSRGGGSVSGMTARCRAPGSAATTA